MIFDTHAHYDDDAFDEDREALLKSMNDNKIEYIVNVSSNLNSCISTIELTQSYNFIYGAIGIHPCDSKELDEDNFNNYVIENITKDKIVAIGEIGLDYYWDEPERRIQTKWFERQLELAIEIKKPVIIHSREAAKDTLDMIKKSNVKDVGGVIHCFSYGVEMAREYLNMGFYLGIGGVSTFKNAKKVREVIEYMPMDKLLLETDCPYLAPVPYRGKRNSSIYLSYVVRTIADIKGISDNEVEEITMENAKRLFKIEAKKIN